MCHSSKPFVRWRWLGIRAESVEHIIISDDDLKKWAENG